MRSAASARQEGLFVRLGYVWAGSCEILNDALLFVGGLSRGATSPLPSNTIRIVQFVAEKPLSQPCLFERGQIR
jgi:hypothetical protein